MKRNGGCCGMRASSSRGREQRSDGAHRSSFPPRPRLLGVRIAAIVDVAEQARLRALERVDLLAVDEQARVADRDRRAGLRAARRSGARRPPCAPRDRAGGSGRRTRPLPRRARGRSRARPPSSSRSRAAARRRRGRGSPAAPDRPGSGTGRTSRRGGRRARRRCARGCPARVISSTRSIISIGGSGRRVAKPSGGSSTRLPCAKASSSSFVELAAGEELAVLHAASPKRTR